MSSLSGQTIFSATTATVLFDRKDVGTVQSVRIDENFNVRPVNVIGSNYPLAHIPGTFFGQITANRMFLDRNALLSIMFPGLTSAEAIGSLVTSIFGNDADVDVATDTAEKLTEIYNAIFPGGSRGTRWNFNVRFDVTIKAADSQTMYEAKDCIITTRSLDLNINNVIAMERVVMMFNGRVR
jgi:hypothetical protein